MMWESVVLPSPGGPNSSTWSSASSRLRAAPMKISSCSRTLTWPTYSSSSLGRSARSMASSCGDTGAAETTRFGRRGQEVVGLDAHGEPDYFASAFSASLMPSLTPTSAGSGLSASAASLSL
jgi:hypothetical protein